MDAFHGFSHPMAWLIRGLVEYGYQDLSLSPRNLPTQTGMGFDVNPLADSGGTQGLRIVYLAMDSKGDWFEAEQTYAFSVRVTRDKWERPTFYLQGDRIHRAAHLLWVPDNPLYAAGYIHQALQAWVPAHIQAIREGTAPSAQQEPLTSATLPIPPQLAQWLQQFVQQRRKLDNPDMEGLWTMQTVQQPPEEQKATPTTASISGLSMPALEDVSSPRIVIGQGLGATITSGSGQILGFDPNQNSTSVAGREKSAAMNKLAPVAKVLSVLCIIGAVMGLLEIANATVTAYMVAKDQTVRLDRTTYTPTILLSTLFGLYSMGMSAWAWMGLASFRQVKRGWWSLAPMIFAATLPVCTCFGLPIAGYALYLWTRPEVKAVWKEDEKT